MKRISRISLDEVWKMRHEVMWPDQSIEYIQLPNDDQGIHLGLFVEDSLVSVISLFIDGDEAQFRKFCTQTYFQNRGYGSELLQYTMDYAKGRGAKAIFCNARVTKCSFYAKFGLIRTENRFVKGGKEYVVMRKTL